MKNAEDKAFPLISTDGMSVNQGLTKREYFAAMAMQGLLMSKPPYEDKSNYGEGERQTKINIQKFAEKSIQIADEMLNQLEK